mgnify:FL=1
MKSKLVNFSNKYVEDLLVHHTKEGSAEKCDPFMKSIYNFKKGNKAKVRAVIHSSPDDPTEVYAIQKDYEQALGKIR